jgi:hypothetical protein
MAYTQIVGDIAGPVTLVNIIEVLEETIASFS